MEFRGRTRELGALRLALDRPEPVLTRVRGLPGAGASALVRRACRELPSLYLTLPPLPDPDQRARLAALLPGGTEAREAPLAPGDAPPSWNELLARLASWAAAGDRPAVLVLDDAHRLTEARARIAGALEAHFARDPEGAPPLHVVLVGRGTGLPAIEVPAPARLLEIPLPPLSFRAAAPLLPGASPLDRLLAFGVFGGLPGTLRHLDTGVGLATNLRRAVLDPAGPLADAGLAILERALQTPARYAAILAVLAEGEADWGTLHRGVRDLTASGQLAPYLNRLEELGLVEARRSLDAGPRSRNRRYRITDPFLAFWFRFVLPHRARIRDEEGWDAWTDAVRPALDVHLGSVFGALCRGYMSLDAMEVLGANGREVGSLWGPGYEIDVAGTLTSGSAFYGRALWADEPKPRHLEELDRQIRETRYGFGRERRLRLLFSPGDFSRDLTRAVARREDALLVGARELAGEE